MTAASDTGGNGKPATEEAEAIAPEPMPLATSSPVQHRVVARMDRIGQNLDGGGGDLTALTSSDGGAKHDDTSNTKTSGAGGGIVGRRRKDKVTPPATPRATTPRPSPADGSGAAAAATQTATASDRSSQSLGDDHDDDEEMHALHDVPVDGHLHRKAAKDEEDSLDRLMDLSSSATVKAGNGAARTRPQTFDIEMAGGTHTSSPDGYDDNNEDDDDDRSQPDQAICCLSRYCCPCLPPCYKIGNATVIIPPLYERTGRYGVIGPHWPGLMFSFALLWGASYYYITQGFAIGPLSGGICVLMTTVCTVLLINVAFSDPGMITKLGQQRSSGGGGKYAGLPTDGRDLSDWRYCDLCAVYQPPDAAHCPDCQVCVEGYDHHCPWMGTCIGKRNMKAFLAFNLSWLFYLMYAIGWVTFGSMAVGVGGGGTDHRGFGYYAGDNSTEGLDNSTGHLLL